MSYYSVVRYSFPQYVDYESRLQTFKQTETRTYARKHCKELATAGFFYVGNSKQNDRVICFHCGGGLKDWLPGDDPWIEHTRWFTNCLFVRINKSPEYINRCIGSVGGSRLILKDRPSNTTEHRAIQCSVCLNYEKEIVFLPCRHCCVCISCSEPLDNCVVCREPISAKMEIYVS
jgi:baculoviral IAP repeat-containing protein 7/8